MTMAMMMIIRNLSKHFQFDCMNPRPRTRIGSLTTLGAPYRRRIPRQNKDKRPVVSQDAPSWFLNALVYQRSRRRHDATKHYAATPGLNFEIPLLQLASGQLHQAPVSPLRALASTASLSILAQVSIRRPGGQRTADRTVLR